MPSRQIAAAIDGWSARAARSAAAPASVSSDSLVADLPDRQHRIVLKRSVELGDLGDRLAAHSAAL